MTDQRTQVAELLLDLEYELRRMDRWADQPPAADAFLSQQPFCIDTMSFAEWSQFVFLQRMHSLLEEGAELPGASGIAPMAEEFFGQRQAESTGLIKVLKKLDACMSST